MSFDSALKALERQHGRPEEPLTRDPYEMVLWENVAYLQTEERRAKAFAELKRRVGLSPKAILSASKEKLLDVAKLGGMRPEDRVTKLRKIAEIASRDFPGGSLGLVAEPGSKIRRILKKFPGIGDPGADRILLFSGVEALPAFDSNGLRVLIRLGLIKEQKSYSATYKVAHLHVKEQVDGAKDEFKRLEKAFQLFRRHGQELCKTSAPACASCSLRATCPSA